MTWFTDSPYEKMMTQKPGHGRHGDSKPPVPRLVLAALVLGTVSRSCRQRKAPSRNTDKDRFMP